ncbi:hypothetical protein L596_028385 [Steinernema carpocapsae]|uniref:BAR domain-containing protein n=1 Tax=Steinernema carpocapsae TaxID=34508 RepID=A0A4U5LYD6_STECR|nr:hypothetical protein L596_028385 [Steinernema carpocapsae]
MATTSSVRKSVERKNKSKENPDRESPPDYPDDFEQEVIRLRAFYVVAESVVESLGSFIRVLEPTPSAPPQTVQCELKQLALCCEKIAHNQILEEAPMIPMLQTTSDVMMNMSKKENGTNQEIYDRVYKPLKSWVDEDYPRISKELKKCYELHTEMTNVAADAAKKPNPVKTVKAEQLKERHNQQFRICQKELENMKMVHKHQQYCLKLMLDLEYTLHGYCERELDNACVVMMKSFEKVAKETKED